MHIIGQFIFIVALNLLGLVVIWCILSLFMPMSPGDFRDYVHTVSGIQVITFSALYLFYYLTGTASRDDMVAGIMYTVLVALVWYFTRPKKRRDKNRLHLWGEKSRALVAKLVSELKSRLPVRGMQPNPA